MREGFEIDDAILTVFERFEVVWPLDLADISNGLERGLKRRNG
jgi:hypothetical protein